MKILCKDITIKADNMKIYNAFTTEEGIKSFFAPDCSIEWRLFGKFELYFAPDAEPGSRGSEGCRVLSFVPGKMISFSWNNPPVLPAIRNEKTFVVIQIAGPISEGKAKVTLQHLGWGQGDDWDKAYEYFDKAWSVVLKQLKEYMEM